MRKYKKITDAMCRAFLREMRTFGYPKLTLDQVQSVADSLEAGTYSKTNVIAVMFARELDDLRHFEQM